MAENAPFCTEYFKNFLRPEMGAAGTIFCTPTFQMKVTPLSHSRSYKLSKEKQKTKFV